eukprot:TRINITY_DN4585_c0_g1_i2.p2 TRINITY_DN4585_c0_g1~~TRINITY_DN4585_c0_g1_i2.p2  ORF type:complete len:210 (-),score=23.54 TRINITY_DN4585_c0_g1_i2:97-726(-)
MVEKVAVKFCFDIASPYSWLALEIILRYEKVWNLDLELVPVLIGGILNKTGNTVGTVKPKAQYASIDIVRSAKWARVPYRGMAANFQQGKENPFRTVFAMRIMVAACQKYGPKSQQVRLLARSFFTTFMHRLSGQVIVEDPQLYFQICRQSGLNEEDCKELVKLGRDQDIKDKLKSNTEWALERCAFGVPTIYVYIDEQWHQYWAFVGV